MHIQSQLLNHETVINSIVDSAVKLYNHVDSTDEDGILIESAVYSAVRSIHQPIDSSSIELIMQLVRSKLQKGKE